MTEWKEKRVNGSTGFLEDRPGDAKTIHGHGVTRKKGEAFKRRIPS
ncbi:MAG: hypothetical protein GWN64_07475 [Candidatus Thorarchaeota archaeon]|nr:hypothetical protein [Candidatus Thorarchaeota archaeon]